MVFGTEMKKDADGPAHGAPGSPLFADAVTGLGSVFVGALVAATFIRFYLSLDWTVVITALTAIAIGQAVVILALPAHGHSRFGAANLVTAIRAAMACLIAAVVVFSDAFSVRQDELIVWGTVAAAVLALAMDGLDGYLARLFRQESAFGARFDMEVDAFLILILSIAAFTLDKAGWWVMLIGGMRYLFVAAQLVEPRLTGDLAPSWRRKAICVVQVSALCLVLVPAIGQPVSSLIAGAALALLVYSFAVDIAALCASRPEAHR